jgi:hypothetical protein
MPRSGTKLTRDLLNQHSQIAIPNIETEFLPYLHHNLGKFGNIESRAGFNHLYAALTRTNYFDFRRLEGEIITSDRWFSACRSFDAAGVFEALIREEVNAPYGSNVIWGDKSPSYIDDLALIAKLYPDARIVHIVRDVRDYCLSIHRAWKKDMLRAAERWADGVMQARADGSVLQDRYLEVRYEDLLVNTETELRRICEFLGLAFEPSMLMLSRPSENLGSTRGESRVVKDNFGKYSEQMSPATLSAIEAIAGDALAAYGYKLECAPQPRRRLSTFERILAQIKDGVNLVRADTEKLGIARSAYFYLRYFITTRG